MVIIMEKPEFWRKGLRFECTSCGHCCRHEPGYVFLSDNDLKHLAGFFTISVEKFSQEYCRTVDVVLAKRLSLTETQDNDCIFWNQGCTVYPARPLQCRSYPFWPAILSDSASWEREAEQCPGIGSGSMHPEQEIETAMKAREHEPLISVGTR